MVGSVTAAAQGRVSPKRLTTSGDVIVAWTWAERGTQLLLACRRSNRHQLWRQRLDSTVQTRVGLDDQIRELSLAQKANTLVYSSGGGNDFNVWRYSLRPVRQAPQPLIASAAFDGDPRYSPDGKRIAFASSRSGQANIWICASDGSGVRQLTSMGAGGFWAGSPAWSPDGKRIAFDMRAPAAESSIFVMDAEGGKPVRLTGPGPSDIIPMWSRDSDWIYFASTRQGGSMQLWKVRSAGGETVQVTHNGGFEAVESPDGRFLYFTKRGRTGGLWRMPVAGGPESRVPGFDAFGSRYWESTNRGIYFVERSTTPALRLFEFSTGHVSKIMDLRMPPSVLYRGLTVSPDGRAFLYMQADPGRSNLMLVENFTEPARSPALPGLLANQRDERPEAAR